MNDGTGGRRRPRRMCWPRTGLLAIAAAIALLTAACSGGSSPGGSAGSPAAGGSAGSSAAAGSGGSSSAGKPATQRRQLAFSECMRSHGVPNVPSSLPTLPATAPTNGPHKWVPASGPDTTRLQAATQACRSVLGQSRPAG
jgi:hypothetical protein